MERQNIGFYLEPGIPYFQAGSNPASRGYPISDISEAKNHILSLSWIQPSYPSVFSDP